MQLDIFIHYPVNPSSDHFHTNAVVQSSDHCRTETVLPSSDRYCIETVSPSGDHYYIDIVVPSSDQCCNETVPQSRDHYGTLKVSPPSDLKERNDVNLLDKKHSSKVAYPVCSAIVGHGLLSMRSVTRWRHVDTCTPSRQRRSQDFCWGGGHPADVTRYIFRDLLKPTRFSGGGGGVAEIFRDLLKPTTFIGGGGGVVGEFVPVAPGKQQSDYLNSGTFFLHFRFK